MESLHLQTLQRHRRVVESKCFDVVIVAVRIAGTEFDGAGHVSSHLADQIFARCLRQLGPQQTLYGT